MRDSPGRRDIDVVVHGALAIGLVAADVFVFLFLIPMLFDQHRSELDLASLVAAGAALAFTYLGGRYLWRSAHHSIGGDDR